MRNMDSVPLKDWEFDELVAAATWDLIGAITKGYPLKSAVHSAMMLAMQWKGERDSAAMTAKK